MRGEARSRRAGANWRTPNNDDLLPCLLSARDLHAWQTGKTTRDQSTKIKGCFKGLITPAAYKKGTVEIGGGFI